MSGLRAWPAWLILLLVCRGMLAQASDGAVVEGRIVNKDISGAIVRLRKEPVDPLAYIDGYSAVVEADGSFRFHDIAPGAYRLTGEAKEWNYGEYGSNISTRPVSDTGLTSELFKGITSVGRAREFPRGPAETPPGFRPCKSWCDRRCMITLRLTDSRPSKGHESDTAIQPSPRPPPWKALLLGAGLLLLLIVATVGGVFLHFYLQFSRIIDARLDGNVFGNPAVILAAPTQLHCGQTANARSIAVHLRRAGYTEGQNVQGVGSFTLTASGLEVRPGPESFFRNGQIVEAPARLEFKSDRLVSMTSLDNMTALDTYWLEPEPITTLFGASRAKRRLVRYQDLPKALVDAILATEDHRFYSHHGVDSFRIIAAALADLRSDKRLEGGSTLTMQLARNLFLTPRRTIRRKMAEIFFAMILEHRLTKEQILVLYANQVYLGQHDSFSIYGFGEAASVYFNKDLSTLTLPEAAFLTGLIRGPNLYLPYEHPKRAAERRNFVLGRMQEAGFISAGQAAQAAVAPLRLTEQPVEARQQAYFVDMVKAQLRAQFSEADLLSKGYRVYTTLDLDLQQAASEGASAGLIELDRQVKRERDRKKKSPPDSGLPQVALVALDPGTGDVKALVGGRAYNESQLNHVLARRQPGSSFKPFVYAAALNSGVDGSLPLITPATVLPDEPTTFEFSNRSYAPRDYEGDYRGSVTVRAALTSPSTCPPCTWRRWSVTTRCATLP